MRVWCQDLGSSIPLSPSWFRPAPGNGQPPSPTRGQGTWGCPCVLAVCAPPWVPPLKAQALHTALTNPPLFTMGFTINTKTSLTGHRALHFCFQIQGIDEG